MVRQVDDRWSTVCQRNIQKEEEPFGTNRIQLFFIRFEFNFYLQNYYLKKNPIITNKTGWNCQWSPRVYALQFGCWSFLSYWSNTIIPWAINFVSYYVEVNKENCALIFFKCYYFECFLLLQRLLDCLYY